MATKLMRYLIVSVPKSEWRKSLRSIVVVVKASSRAEAIRLVSDQLPFSREWLRPRVIPLAYGVVHNI